MPFVLDASVTAAWILPDEDDPLGSEVQKRLTHDSALVPPIWWFEVRNLLVVAERRGRLRPTITDQIVAMLSVYPIVENADVDEAALLRLAREHGLSVYDASYLELAGRLRLPLATLDRKLIKAAEQEAIAVIVRG